MSTVDTPPPPPFEAGAPAATPPEVVEPALVETTAIETTGAEAVAAPPAKAAHVPPGLATADATVPNGRPADPGASGRAHNQK